MIESLGGSRGLLNARPERWRQRGSRASIGAMDPTESERSGPSAEELELGMHAELKLETHGEAAFPGKGGRPHTADELTRLRRENARLREERDILKKAAAYFAKDQA